MSEQSETRQTKAELLERMATARGALEAAIGRMTNEQLTRPGPDGWSVKDHLAHLSVWERSLLGLLRGESRAAAVGIDEQAYAGHDIDSLNATFHARDKDRPPAEVLADFRRSRKEVLAALAPMTDEDLYKPYSHYQPNDPPANPDPVIGWIVGNTYEHDEEHLGWIERIGT